MSKSEILQELPKLALEERREILERICELEENDLLKGSEPTAEEKALLDQELEDSALKATASLSFEFYMANAIIRGGSEESCFIKTEGTSAYDRRRLCNLQL